METYNHINYKKCFYFNVGTLNQWQERGFLVHEGMVYHFYDDRHDNYYEVSMKMTPEEFRVYARKQKLKVPSGFI